MAKTDLLADLTDEEVARLPGRVRAALNHDEQSAAWNAAKAQRDAAIEAAAGDPDAIADAKAAWAAAKADLLGA